MSMVKTHHGDSKGKLSDEKHALLLIYATSDLRFSNLVSYTEGDQTKRSASCNVMAILKGSPAGNVAWNTERTAGVPPAIHSSLPLRTHR